jgi:hypothetical protein
MGSKIARSWARKASRREAMAAASDEAAPGAASAEGAPAAASLVTGASALGGRGGAVSAAGVASAVLAVWRVELPAQPPRNNNRLTCFIVGGSSPGDGRVRERAQAATATRLRST